MTFIQKQGYKSALKQPSQLVVFEGSASLKVEKTAKEKLQYSEAIFILKFRIIKMVFVSF